MREMMLCGCEQLVTRTKKMFVGGLSASTTAADVKAYFEQFGPVSDAFCCCSLVV